jgi:hypothetical protein
MKQIDLVDFLNNQEQTASDDILYELPVYDSYTRGQANYVGCCFFEKCCQKTKDNHPQVHSIIYSRRGAGGYNGFIEVISATYKGITIYFEFTRYNNADELNTNYSLEEKEFIRSKINNYFGIK